MLSNMVKLECKIAERIYHFLCDHDSPVTEVKEALSRFFEFAQNVEKQASESTQSSPESASYVEENKKKEPKPQEGSPESSPEEPKSDEVPVPIEEPKPDEVSPSTEESHPDEAPRCTEEPKPQEVTQ